MVAEPAADATPAALRDAATVVLLREGPAGGPLEVLLLRRHARSGFAASMWVFPGGVVDPADRRLDPACRSGDVAALAPLAGREPGDALGLAVAAVRETFEEAGVLLARHADGTPVDLDDPEVAPMRHALAERTTRRRAAGGGGAHDPTPPSLDFNGWLASAGLVLDLGALVPWSRWRTPEQEPRRYDTLFFLARAPLGQVADHDRVETTGSRWLAPAAALAEHAAGRLELIYPTIRTLAELAPHPTLDALLAAAPTARLRLIQPHVELVDGRAARIVHPDDADFPWDLYGDRHPEGRR